MRIILTVLAVLLFAAPLAAHEDTVAYSRMVIRADGNVEFALKIPVEDLAETLGRQGHTALNAPEVRGAEDLLFRHFMPLVGMSSGGKPCPVERSGIDVPEDERLYGELRLRFRCPSGAPVTVDYRVFFDIDPGHVGRLEVETPGGKGRAEFIREKPRWEVSAVEDGPPQVRAIDGAAAPPTVASSPVVDVGSSVAEPTKPLEEADPVVEPSTSPPTSLENAVNAERRPSSYWMPMVLGLIVAAGAGAFYARRRSSASS